MDNLLDQLLQANSVEKVHRLILAFKKKKNIKKTTRPMKKTPKKKVVEHVEEYLPYPDRPWIKPYQIIPDEIFEDDDDAAAACL